MTLDTVRSLLPSLAVLPLLLAGCAMGPTQHARSWFDERTAATITAQEPCAVFAHEDQMRAINVRDYVQAGAVEVNRSGSRRYYLVLLSWSTIDRPERERAAFDAELTRSTILADDRQIELQRVPGGRSAVGVAAGPYRTPTPAALESWYPITLNEIRALAGAGTLNLMAHAGETPRRYELWQADGRAFAGFLQYITAPH